MKKKCKYNNNWQLTIGNWQIVVFVIPNGLKNLVLNKKASDFFTMLKFLIVALTVVSCGEPAKQNEQQQSETENPKPMASHPETYYCPMHPEIVQDHPGTCPKPECKGMELVLKVSEDALNIVLKPVTSSVLSSVKTIHPIEQEVSLDFEAMGTINFDPLTYHNIASRINGRIEKLYIKYNYQQVKKGERLFDIYSPELVTAQENILYLLNTDGSELNLIAAAKQKLNLLGFTEEQMDELLTTKKVKYSIPVYSKWEGQVQESNNEQLNSNVSDGMSNMADNSTNSATASKNSGIVGALQTPVLTVKEGMYVTRGQTVFNLMDPHQLIAVLQVRSENIAKLQLNQQVELILDNDTNNKIVSKINFIEPFLKPNSKTLAIRVNIDNSNLKIKAGTFVKAKIKAEPTEGLFIPYQAVIDLGKQKMVWIKKEGYFVAKKIETGVITKEWVEIYDGITAKDEIAKEAHYLNDSESFIKISKDESDELE